MAVRLPKLCRNPISAHTYPYQPGPRPGELRLPTPPRPASAGGLGGESQAGLPALQSESLMVRNKKPKRHATCRKRTERPVAAGMDESWSMDFMSMDFLSDELFDGRRIRLLTIVDNFSRESLAIKVGASIRGQEVVDVLQQLMEQHRLPGSYGWTRSGVHVNTAGPVGLPERGGTGLQLSRQAHGQRFHRGIQLEIPAGVPERELVPVPGGCRGKCGILAEPLQWRKTAQHPGKPDPQGVRRAGGNRRLTRKTNNSSVGPPTLPAPRHGNHETRDDAVYAGIIKPEENRRRARSVEI